MLFDILMYRIIEETELVGIFIIKLPFIAHFELIILGIAQILTILCVYSQRE